MAVRCLLGIDIGTSGAKAVLMEASGRVVGTSLREYPMDTPRPGWSEQDPRRWWEAVVANIRQVLGQACVDAARVAGIGLSGQMHGTVLLDRHLEVIRPAIIWADQRSSQQCREVYDRVGREGLAEMTANPVAPGFTAASLLWIKENEPKLFARVHTVLLPKDYVRLGLCGELGTDVSDASASLLFDTVNRRWSARLLEALDLDPGLLPQVHESTQVVGQVTQAAAEATGLAVGTPVVAGGGDQPVAALGNGVIREGTVLCTIGTGGQLFTPTGVPRFDPKLRTHTFCHVVPGLWFVMGATLCAGLSLKWFRDRIGGGSYEELARQAAEVPPGAEGLIFLPYLIGERTPHMDPQARGAFIGLTLRHGRAHLVRAVMEGVVMALRDALEIFGALGMPIGRIIASGGGAKSALWRQIQADVFQREVATTCTQEQAGVGAAMLSGIGAGVYENAEAACDQVVRLGEAVQPCAARSDLYNRLYEVFAGLYPKLKADFARVGALQDPEQTPGRGVS